MRKLMNSSKLTQRLDDVRKEINLRAAGVSPSALGSEHLSSYEASAAAGNMVEAKRVVSEEGVHYVLIKKTPLPPKPRKPVQRANKQDSGLHCRLPVGAV